MRKTKHERSTAEKNDAAMVLRGLPLAILAPSDERAKHTAALVWTLFEKSDLTDEDLEDLQAAAVVLTTDTERI